MTEDTTGRDIFVLDDDSAVRITIAKVLAAEGYSTTCFADSFSLLKAARRHAPLCILLDIYLPGASGLDVLRTLRAQACNVPILIVSGKGDIATAVEALRIGADDYVEKPFSGNDLVARMKTLIARYSAQCERPVSARHLPGFDTLTQREVQIVDQCLAGATSKEAAQRLGISFRTVEDYRSSIMRKLGVKNVAEMVRIAIAHDRTPARRAPMATEAAGAGIESVD